VTVLDERPVVAASPLRRGCSVSWCVSNHDDPYMVNIHVSRTAVFTPPSDMEPEGEFLAAELWQDSSSATSTTWINLNHDGNGILLDAGESDKAIRGLLEFVAQFMALRAQMDA
jgi:hypothetical protein